MLPLPGITANKPTYAWQRLRSLKAAITSQQHNTDAVLFYLYRPVPEYNISVHTVVRQWVKPFY